MRENTRAGFSKYWKLYFKAVLLDILGFVLAGWDVYFLYESEISCTPHPNCFLISRTDQRIDHTSDTFGSSQSRF
jgi:hypothetical protein